tara:strand:- start:463 stop:2766 length:2304 start_codon:yes stop_codon:yes gene_type:complete
MAKSYRRVGIRRDNNFSDISDRKKALNNLLDKLGTDIPGGTFISEDLDAIRGLFSIGLSAGEYRQFAGSTVRETNIDGTTRAANPLITYQNRLEKFKVDSGNSPRLNGGDGPTANYFNADQVKFETEPDVFVGVTTGPSIPSDNFWEDGNFVYSRKINAQSINAAGGVQWDGSFVPTLTGEYTFTSSSTLGFTFDFEAEGYTTGIGTFKKIAGIGLTVVIDNSGGFTLTPDNANDRVTILGTGTASLAPSIGIGMTVAAVSTAGRITLGSKVSGVSTASSPESITISFTNLDDDPVDGSGALTSIKLERRPGTSVSKTYTTYTLEKFRPYKIRYRFFVPEGVSPIGVEKKAQFLYATPGANSSGYLRYNNLYSVGYDFSEESKGEFNKFLDQSILFGGNKDDGTETIGSGTNSDGYVRVSTNKKIAINYEPKTALTQIEKAEKTGVSWTAGTKIINLSDTTGIEIGNYVFAGAQGLTANVNTPVRVTDVIINSFIVIDTAATNTRSGQTLTFIDHRGFVKRVTANTSNSTTISITGADTNPATLGLRSNQIAIWGGNQTSAAYTGITTDGANTTVTMSPAQTFTQRKVYFYESRGLIDKALATFCVPAQTQCFVVSTGVNAGNNVLPVSSNTSAIQPGWRVLGFPFADGTKVQSKTANSITLDTVTIKNIAPESNYTSTSSLDDKSLCCPPTDTSPPFESTEIGLQTPSAFPDIKINQGNVKFDNLTILSPQGKNNVSALNTALVPASGNVLPILGGDGITYNLICE